MSISRFISSVYTSYPDNQDIKEVFFQAEGMVYDGSTDRHVLLFWVNGSGTSPSKSITSEVAQLVHLTGQPSNYAFYSPVAKFRSPTSRMVNYQKNLGTYTRAQRDKILELARAVKFEKTSVVNDCRTWMKDLLSAMLQEGLIKREHFDEFIQTVPLPDRQPELV